MLVVHSQAPTRPSYSFGPLPNITGIPCLKLPARIVLTAAKRLHTQWSPASNFFRRIPLLTTSRTIRTMGASPSNSRDRDLARESAEQARRVLRPRPTLSSTLAVAYSNYYQTP